MRVYVPLTVAGLRRTIAAGAVSPRGGVVFAVTEDLRREYPGADDEELEYLAMTDAARASLRLLSGGPPGQAWLRVVLAADVAEASPTPQLDRAAARVDGPISWPQIASVHLDGADAADAVRAAAEVVDAADLGDDDAEFAVGTAEDHALAWYAPSEVVYLLQDVDPQPG